MFTKCLIGNFGGKNVSLYINIVKNLCTHKMLYLRQFESMSTHLQGGINTVQCTYLIHSKQYINLLAQAFVRKKNRRDFEKSLSFHEANPQND